MTKLRGLGKGLDALLTASEVTPSDIKTGVEELTLDRIKPGKFQPRQVFDEASIKELADSILHNGVIQPLVVRKLGNSYEIIAGERRFRASKLAGLKRVPVIVKSFSDEEALAIALIENIQRKDLNVIEEALGYKRLIDEFSLTHEKIAIITGRSRSHISNILRLLNLHTSVQEMLMHEQLDMGHARALLPLAKSQQLSLGQSVIKNGLSTAETERLVAKLLHEKSAVVEHGYSDIAVEADISRLEHKLTKKLGGLPVIIKHGRKGNGQVTFSYKSLDDLNRLIKLL